jgi:hypothetical protein
MREAIAFVQVQFLGKGIGSGDPRPAGGFLPARIGLMESQVGGQLILYGRTHVSPCHRQSAGRRRDVFARHHDSAHRSGAQVQQGRPAHSRFDPVRRQVQEHGGRGALGAAVGQSCGRQYDRPALFGVPVDLERVVRVRPVAVDGHARVASQVPDSYQGQVRIVAVQAGNRPTAVGEGGQNLGWAAVHSAGFPVDGQVFLATDHMGAGQYHSRSNKETCPRARAQHSDY